MRVHHLNCGTMRPIGGRLVDGRGGFLHRAEMVCHCLLLETYAGLLLIETGPGSPAVQRPDEWLGRWFLRATKPVLDDRQTAASLVKKNSASPSKTSGISCSPNSTSTTPVDLSTFRMPRFTCTPKNVARSSNHATTPSAPGIARFSSRTTPSGAVTETWANLIRLHRGPRVRRAAAGNHADPAGRAHPRACRGRRRHRRRLAAARHDAYFFHGEVDPVRPHCPPGLAMFEARLQTEKRPRLDNQRRLRKLVREHGEE
jgi:hypothetical protein